jgi:branched-subunit amino acid transport protein
MEIALLIAGMAAVTYAIRYSMIVILGRWEIPSLARRALRFVPIAAFAAIITPGLVGKSGIEFIGLDLPRLIACGLAIVVAVISRQMLLTIAAGMGSMWLLQFLLR